MPTIFTKPTLACLFLHQIAWEESFEHEWITYCKYCKKSFFYPTKREHKPVYKKYS